MRVTKVNSAENSTLYALWKPEPLVVMQTATTLMTNQSFSTNTTTNILKDYTVTLPEGYTVLKITSGGSITAGAYSCARVLAIHAGTTYTIGEANASSSSSSITYSLNRTCTFTLPEGTNGTSTVRIVFAFYGNDSSNNTVKINSIIFE